MARIEQYIEKSNLGLRIKKRDLDAFHELYKNSIRWEILLKGARGTLSPEEEIIFQKWLARDIRDKALLRENVPGLVVGQYNLRFAYRCG